MDRTLPQNQSIELQQQVAYRAELLKEAHYLQGLRAD